MIEKINAILAYISATMIILGVMIQIFFFVKKKVSESFADASGVILVLGAFIPSFIGVMGEFWVSSVGAISLYGIVNCLCALFSVSLWVILFKEGYDPIKRETE